MTNEQTASSAEGQAFDLILLRVIFPCVINLPARRGFVAKGNTAQLGGRRNVAFHQCRRNLQTTLDIVEAITGIIGGEVDGWIDVESNKLANGVGVFRSVQPVHTRRG